LKAGKDVYCEKPMIHLYSDGPEMIEASKQTGKILQIGSQRVSSVIYAKAKELLAAGAIGQLNMVTARWDRNSTMGAWSYTVPPTPPLNPATGLAFLGPLRNPLQRRALLSMEKVESLRKRRRGRFVRTPLQRNPFHHRL